MTDKRTIAALCVSGRSIYKHIDGVVAYDREKDARSFTGGIPVIAHPPCRCWSKYLKHQSHANAPALEMRLGLWCVQQVIEHGGVLEQPADSLLFHAANLPVPISQVPGNAKETAGYLALSVDPFLYTIYVEQSWFGYATKKPTWLLISGVPIRSMPPIPFTGAKGQAFGTGKKNLSRAGNSRTMPAFAEWLCQIARGSWWSMPNRRSAQFDPTETF